MNEPAGHYGRDAPEGRDAPDGRIDRRANDELTNTVGIHPTSAETFTDLTITKSSGESADSKGC